MSKWSVFSSVDNVLVNKRHSQYYSRVRSLHSVAVTSVAASL